MSYEDLFAPAAIGRIVHEETVDKPLPGTPLRQRAYMFASMVGVAAALKLLEEGDLEAVKQQLLTTTQVQVDWLHEDFDACHRPNERDKEEERNATRAAFFLARADHFINAETGEVNFNPPKPAEDDRGPDDFVGAVPV